MRPCFPSRFSEQKFVTLFLFLHFEKKKKGNNQLEDAVSVQPTCPVYLQICLKIIIFLKAYTSISEVIVFTYCSLLFADGWLLTAVIYFCPRVIRLNCPPACYVTWAASGLSRQMPCAEKVCLRTSL